MPLLYIPRFFEHTALVLYSTPCCIRRVPGRDFDAAGIQVTIPHSSDDDGARIRCCRMSFAGDRRVGVASFGVVIILRCKNAEVSSITVGARRSVDEWGWGSPQVNKFFRTTN
jgi:hypothetical protein